MRLLRVLGYVAAFLLACLVGAVYVVIALHLMAHWFGPLQNGLAGLAPALAGS